MKGIWRAIFILILPAALFSSPSSDRFLGDTGTVIQYLLPVTAIGMTAYHLDRQGNIQFLKAFGTSEVIKEVLKHTVHSVRPNGGKHSFPSGHTSCSFASSAFIQMRYGWKYGIPAYMAASFVAYTRLQVRAHRFVDVAAGAALGILCNVVFTTSYKGCQIKAAPAPGGGVVAFNCDF